MTQRCNLAHLGRFIAVLAVGASLAACGTSGSTAAPHPTVKVLNINGCDTPPKAAAGRAYPPSDRRTHVGPTYTARIVTNCGTIIVLLDGRVAPRAVSTFLALSRRGFFTRAPCPHLVTPTSSASILQCGLPTGTEAPTVDIDPNAPLFPAGTVSTNPGPGGRIAFAYARTHLPASDLPFGHVVTGLDVLTRIANAGTAAGPGERPRQSVVIESVGVTRGRPA